MRSRRLDYWGVMTDGGLDDEQLEYWVDNMFDGDIESYYCSKMHRSKNVRCIALSPPQTIRDRLSRISSFEYGKDCHFHGPGEGGRREEDSPRVEVLADTAMVGLLKRMGQPANNQISINTGVRIGRMGDLTCPVSCGVVIIGDFDYMQRLKQAGEESLLEEIYASTMIPIAETLSVCTDLESILCACKTQELQVPTVVSLGQSGEWAEFSGVDQSSCALGESKDEPNGLMGKVASVIWFRFRRKREPSLLDEAYSKHITSEFSSLGVECAIVEDKVKACPWAPFHEESDDSSQVGHFINFGEGSSEHDAGGGDVEVEMEVDELADDEEVLFHDPDFAIDLQWVFLNSPDGLRRYTSRKSMEGKEHMDIELRKPVIGNTACVILNGCENLMEEMRDMHEGPNIDVNFVWMMGTQIDIAD